MKKSSLILGILLLCNLLSFAQLYVSSAGNVAIGNSSPSARFQISNASKNFTFKPKGDGSMEIGAYNGSSNTPIIFWHSNAGYNSLTARAFNKSSDSTLKQNIRPIEKPIEVLKKIGGYSYFYNEKKDGEGTPEYGVIAQEVEKVIPELVSVSKDYKVVDYDQFIPFLIEAIKEQQTIIEDLQNKLEALNGSKNASEIQSDIKSLNLSSTNYSTEENMVLFQNAPNPFNSSTTIKCFIPKNFQNVQLCIYDMRGEKVKCFDITDRGNIELNVEASSLAAGIYAYTLIGDGKVSDTKQMILTK